MRSGSTYLQALKSDASGRFAPAPSATSLGTAELSPPRAPLTFDFIPTGEGYCRLSLSPGVSIERLEARIRKLWEKTADSTEERRSLSSAIFAVVHDRVCLLPNFVPGIEDSLTYPEFIRKIASIDGGRLRALYGVLDYHYQVLAGEGTAYFLDLFKDHPTASDPPSMLDLVFVSNQKAVERMMGLPVFPINVAAARQLLGISQTSEKQEVVRAIRELHNIPEDSKKFTDGEIFGSVLLLGEMKQNGLSPTSATFVECLVHPMRKFLLKMIHQMDLDDVTKNFLFSAAAKLHVQVEERSDLDNGNDEPDAKAFGDQLLTIAETRSSLAKANRTIEELKAKIQSLTQARKKTSTDSTTPRNENQASLPGFEEMKKKRAEDQKEIGKLRGSLKRIHSLMETKETDLQQAKVELATYRANSKPNISSTNERDVSSPSSSASPASPVIDFTIQRLLAENAELKRQLKEEKAKNRA
ncbi:hypothetical protein JCM5350_003843 [Sporobolomyces pararoseus]